MMEPEFLFFFGRVRLYVFGVFCHLHSRLLACDLIRGQSIIVAFCMGFSTVIRKCGAASPAKFLIRVTYHAPNHTDQPQRTLVASFGSSSELSKYRAKTL
jgi:hypothetical protein